MKSDEEWTIVYYTAENGTKPVEEFLLRLDKKTYGQLLKAIKFLQEHNIQAREPHVKHIEGKLWEFRKRVNTNAYRIFYMTFTDKQIVLLHAFLKKKQKTPEKELEIARQRLFRYEATHGGNE